MHCTKLWRTWLSRMFPVALDRLNNRESSSFFSSVLLLLICSISDSRASSRSGRSCFTTTLSSWSARPCRGGSQRLAASSAVLQAVQNDPQKLNELTGWVTE